MHPSVQYVCDLCTEEEPATADLRMTWGGRHYRVDLCVRHERDVDKVLRLWISRKTSSRRARGETRAAGGYSPKQVREWARRKKIPVPDRGRIPNDVVEKYLRAHP